MKALYSNLDLMRLLYKINNMIGSAPHQVDLRNWIIANSLIQLPNILSTLAFYLRLLWNIMPKNRIYRTTWILIFLTIFLNWPELTLLLLSSFQSSLLKALVETPFITTLKYKTLEYKKLGNMNWKLGNLNNFIRNSIICITYIIKR